LSVEGDPATPLPAITGESLQVSRYLGLARSTIKGQVMLRDLRAGGTVNLSGTKIENPGATALDLERARIGGDVFIRPFERPGAPAEPALVTGGIIMTGAAISGSVLIAGQSLKNDEARLLFNRINVSGVFRFADIICGGGQLSFANAKVSAFADDGT